MSLASDMAAGYGLGRRIGDDFSSSRFAKAEAKLKEELAQRAQTEGKPLEDYFDEYRDRLQQLAVDKGVRRRAIEIGGKRLEDDASDNYRQGLTDAAMRRGGRTAAGGDLAGGMRQIADSRYALGDVETGMKAGAAADDLALGASAVDANGKVDVLALGRGKAKNAARYGDLAGAQQAESENMARAKQLANSHYGQAAVYASAGNMEHALPIINAGLQLDPRWGSNLSVRAGAGPDADKVYLVQGAAEDGTGGTAIDTMAASEVPQFLETFAQDPDKLLQQAAGARAADAQATREARREMDAKGTQAKADLIKELLKAGIDGTLAKQTVDSRAQASQSGWKFNGAPQAGEDGVSYQMAVAPDGRAVRIQFNDGEQTVEGGPQVPVIITDINTGEVLPPGSLPAGDAIQTYGSAVTRMGNAAQVGNMLETGLRLLDQVYGGDGGRGQRGTNPQGAIDFGNDETNDYVANITEAVGDVSGLGSAEEIADHVMDALVQQESAGNPNAVSPKGAFGLAQLMPATARDPGFGITPLQNDTPEENLRLGRDYLIAMLERYDNNLPLALAAYNLGFAKVDEIAARQGVQPSGAGAPEKAVSLPPGADPNWQPTKRVAVNGRVVPLSPVQPKSGFMSGKVTADDINSMAEFFKSMPPPSQPQQPVAAAIPPRLVPGVVDPRLLPNTGNPQLDALMQQYNAQRLAPR